MSLLLLPACLFAASAVIGAAAGRQWMVVLGSLSAAAVALCEHGGLL